MCKRCSHCKVQKQIKVQLKLHNFKFEPHSLTPWAKQRSTSSRRCSLHCSFALILGMSGENTLLLSAKTLKRSKENFVSQHSGTNLTELCSLVALVPCLSFLLKAFARSYRTNSSCIKFNGCIRVMLQFVCIVLPTVLTVTSEALVWPFLWLVLVLVFLTGCWRLLRGSVVITRSLHHLAEQHHKRSGTDSLGL